MKNLFIESLLIVFTSPFFTPLSAYAVEGRYVCYGNGLSQILGVAEFEVWSNGKNMVRDKPESFTLHCLAIQNSETISSCFRNLTDGNTNTLERWPHTLEIHADARARNIDHQRIDLWRNYPEPRTTWRGIAPTLELSGPGIERQLIPSQWLKH